MYERVIFEATDHTGHVWVSLVLPFDSITEAITKCSYNALFEHWPACWEHVINYSNL